MEDIFHHHNIIDFDMPKFEEVLNSELGMPIEYSNYKTSESSSNEVSTQVSTAVLMQCQSDVPASTVMLSSQPQAKLLMIESPFFRFISGIELNRCHLISKEECLANEALTACT
jgi:hypothetical protein